MAMSADMEQPTDVAPDMIAVGMPRAVAVFGPAIGAVKARTELRRYVRFLVKLLRPAYAQLLPAEQDEVLEEIRGAEPRWSHRTKIVK